MITKNTTSPNFGELRVLESYRHLGIQGRRSLEDMSPFLDVISRDCDLAIGAMPNANLKGDKHTLVAMAGHLQSPEIKLLKKIKNAFIPTIALSQSCTDAVSPRSLYANAAMAKTRLMNALGVSDITFAKQLEEFQSYPSVINVFERFNQSFTRVPTALEISTDTFAGQTTALQNRKNFRLLNK